MLDVCTRIYGVIKTKYSERDYFTYMHTRIRIRTEPLIGHGKIKIVPCIKSCAQDDLVITRK